MQTFIILTLRIIYPLSDEMNSARMILHINPKGREFYLFIYLFPYLLIYLMVVFILRIFIILHVWLMKHESMKFRYYSIDCLVYIKNEI